MRELPILFSGAMVRAILDGRKTQTRRVIAKQPFDRSWSRHDHRIQYVSGRAENQDETDGFYAYSTSSGGEWQAKSPFGQPGDRLWVRETHAIFATYGQRRVDGERWGPWGGLSTVVSPDGKQIVYFREGFDRCDPGRWRPSIHMPRWASRILLEVAEVRVERLQTITEDDARAEGIAEVPGQSGEPGAWWTGDVKEGSALHGHTPVAAFGRLWNSLNAARDHGWDANPWVWVVSFKPVSSTGA
ncbi:ASCH domain-containing protein [Chitinasiproducens palmae]